MLDRTSTYTSAAESIALPKLVDLGGGVIGVAYEVMKVLPALKIIESAIEAGRIGQDTTVVETTSGTFGLGLALVCAAKGIPLHLVSDPALDGYLKQRILDLGVKISFVEKPDAIGGYQAARLRLVHEVSKRYPDVFIPSQYNNPENANAYTAVARLIAEQAGIPGAIVGPVGSGGSLSGTSRALRALDSSIRVVAVDTHRSVLFGQADGPRELRGLGNSLIPENLDRSLVDEVHWLDAATAYKATRALHQRHALYMGPTSGASYHVARHVVASTGKVTVAIMPDSGHRYEATVYHDPWLHSQIDANTPIIEKPHQVSAIPTAGTGWMSMPWEHSTKPSTPQETRTTETASAN